MRDRAIIVLIIAAGLYLWGCAEKEPVVSETGITTRETLESIRLEMPSAETEEPSGMPQSVWIQPDGRSIRERIAVPEGYERVECEEGSFGAFVRDYPLKADGAPVVYYNGAEKPRDHHAAVFDMYLGERDLQQCADSVMRMIAEYYYASGAYEQIHFEFVNGFDCRYDKWRQGQRVKIDGNSVSWVAGGEAGDTPEYTFAEGSLKRLRALN